MGSGKAGTIPKKCNIVLPNIHLRELFGSIEAELAEIDDYLLNSIFLANDLIKDGVIYLLQAGGKRIRPAFTLFASHFGTKKSALPAAAAMELVHMVSLIHDDVIDASALRRGKATLSKLYGNNYAIHLGDYLFAKALAIIDGYQNTELNAKLAHTSMEMCRGEIEQISNEFGVLQSTKEYLYCINQKTSLLISLCFEAGALVSGASQEVVNSLGRYGHCFGMAFQIADDILDYIADEQILGKPVGNDLQQRVITLPLIYFLKHGNVEARQEVKHILAKKSVTTDEIVYIKQVIRESRALEYSQELVNNYALKALRQLDKLPDNQTSQTLRRMALLYYQS